jgi:hypothetical protein
MYKLIKVCAVLLILFGVLAVFGGIISSGEANVDSLATVIGGGIFIAFGMSLIYFHKI